MKSKHDKILYYLSKQYKESLVHKVTIIPWIAASKSSDSKILLDLLPEVSQTQDIRATKITIWKNNWYVETNRKKLENYEINLLQEVSLSNMYIRTTKIPMWKLKCRNVNEQVKTFTLRQAKKFNHFPSYRVLGWISSQPCVA